MATAKEISDALDKADKASKEVEEHLGLIPTNNAEVLGFDEELNFSIGYLREMRSWISKVFGETP